MTSNLHRIKWGVRGVLVVAAAASVGANVLHAQPNWTSRAFAGWAPLCLLGAIELVAKVPATRKASSGIRVAAMVVIAFIAAWVSYWQQAGVLKHYGETGHGSQYMLPLTVDGLIVIASVSLVEIAERIRAAQSVAGTLEPPAAQAPRSVRCPDLGESHAAQPAPLFAPEPAAQPTDDAAQEPAPLPAPARSVARPTSRATRPAKSAANPVDWDAVRSEYASGVGLAQIRERYNGSAPGKRTFEMRTKDLREIHAQAQATARAALAEATRGEG